MKVNLNIPSVIDPLVEEFTELSAQFAESYDRRPTIREFLMLLAEGIRWSRDQFLNDVNGFNLERLDAELLHKTLGSTSPNPISTSEITDNVLALSCRTISTASHHIGAITGSGSSLADLCEALGDAFTKSPSDLLLDISPADVKVLKAQMKKRGKVAAKVGDVIAIPATDSGRFYFAVVTAKNRFGTAYGFFKGNFAPKAPTELIALPVLESSIYAGEQCLVAGRWTIIGNEEALLGRFSPNQELFHRPRPKEPFGLAESPDGKIRSLQKEEAARMGLLDNSYRQVYTCDFLEKRLPVLFGTT